jgi:hypothetical protein
MGRRIVLSWTGAALAVLGGRLLPFEAVESGLRSSMRDARADMFTKYFKEVRSVQMVFVAIGPPTQQSTMLASAMRI